MRFTLLTAIAAILALGSGKAHALALPKDELEDRTKDLQLAPPAELPPESDETVKLIAELGTALASGNTETFHVNTDTRLIITPSAFWLLETRGMALYEESRGETTANSWSLAQRGDRFLSERISLFAAAQIERNTFAGIGRRLSGQFGSAYIVWRTRDPARENLITNRLRLELGGYGAREDFVAPPNDPGAVVPEDHRVIYAARAAISYLHGVSRSTNLGADVEYIQDFVDVENVVVNSSVYAAASIVDGFALKITATHRFDNVPASAEPPLKKNDFLLTAGVVVTL